MRSGEIRASEKGSAPLRERRVLNGMNNLPDALLSNLQVARKVVRLTRTPRFLVSIHLVWIFMFHLLRYTPYLGVAPQGFLREQRFLSQSVLRRSLRCPRVIAKRLHK